MSTVKEIDPSSIDEINSKIEEKLAEIEKEFGVKVELGNTRYSDSYYTTKMKVATVSEDGKVKSKKVVAFERKQKQGVISEKYEVNGRVRTPKGETFIIDGYNTSARKYHIQLHNRDRNVKMSVDMLEMCEVIKY